jgi:hypothetical protein
MSRRLRGGIAVAAVAGLAALGGCAPVTFAGGQGLALGLSPNGFGMSSASCALTGMSSYAGMSMNAGLQVAAYKQQISTIQSKLSLGARSVAHRMEGWKRAATGGC